MSIGKRLLAFRQQQGLSQQELADYLHVSRQTVSKWESDLSLPDMKTALSIAEFYNITINELLGLEEETPDESLRKVYEQTNIVLENIQKDTKRRKIRDYILIGLCAVCIVLLVFIFLEVKEENRIVVHHNTPVIQQTTNVQPDCNIIKYHLDKKSVEVNIIITLDSLESDSRVLLHLKDRQGQEYQYVMNKIGMFKYEFLGEIPFKEFEESFVVVSNEVKSNKYEIVNTSLDVVRRFVENYVDLEMFINFQDEESLYNVTYLKNKHFKYKYDGSFDADVYVKVSAYDGKKDEVLLEDKCKLFEERQMKLNRRFHMLENINTTCSIVYEGTTYSLSHSQKYIYNQNLSGLLKLLDIRA